MHKHFVDRLRAQRSRPKDAAGDAVPELAQRPMQADRLELRDLDRSLEPAGGAARGAAARRRRGAELPRGRAGARRAGRHDHVAPVGRPRAAAPQDAAGEVTMDDTPSPAGHESAGGAPITEADLDAHVDRQLAPTRHAEVGRFLSLRPGDLERVRDWRAQNEAMRGGLGPVVDEPLPLRLALRPGVSPWPWRGIAAAAALVAAASAALACSVRSMPRPPGSRSRHRRRSTPSSPAWRIGPPSPMSFSAPTHAARRRWAPNRSSPGHLADPPTRRRRASAAPLRARLGAHRRPTPPRRQVPGRPVHVRLGERAAAHRVRDARGRGPGHGVPLRQ